jgi:hypothetical protein
MDRVTYMQGLDLDEVARAKRPYFEWTCSQFTVCTLRAGLRDQGKGGQGGAEGGDGAIERKRDEAGGRRGDGKKGEPECRHGRLHRAGSKVAKHAVGSGERCAAHGATRNRLRNVPAVRPLKTERTAGRALRFPKSSSSAPTNPTSAICEPPRPYPRHQR